MNPSAHSEVVMRTAFFWVAFSGHDVAPCTFRFVQLRQQSWLKAVMLQEGQGCYIVVVLLVLLNCVDTVAACLRGDWFGWFFLGSSFSV